MNGKSYFSQSTPHSFVFVISLILAAFFGCMFLSGFSLSILVSVLKNSLVWRRKKKWFQFGLVWKWRNGSPNYNIGFLHETLFLIFSSSHFSYTLKSPLFSSILNYARSFEALNTPSTQISTPKKLKFNPWLTIVNLWSWRIPFESVFG